VALENGCMCDLSQVTYATCPDWQTGWTVFYDYGQSFHFEQVLINRGQYGFQGKQLGEACEQDSLRAPDPVAMSLV
jgi:hypothetical protein